MKTILVTGGAGFIGSNYINYLLEVAEEVKVVNLDKLTYAGDLANIENPQHPNYQFVEGDICDLQLVQELFKTSPI